MVIIMVWNSNLPSCSSLSFSWVISNIQTSCALTRLHEDKVCSQFSSSNSTVSFNCRSCTVRQQILNIWVSVQSQRQKLCLPLVKKGVVSFVCHFNPLQVTACWHSGDSCYISWKYFYDPQISDKSIRLDSWLTHLLTNNPVSNECWGKHKGDIEIICKYHGVFPAGIFHANWIIASTSRLQNTSLQCMTSWRTCMISRIMLLVMDLIQRNPGTPPSELIFHENIWRQAFLSKQ